MSNTYQGDHVIVDGSAVASTASPVLSVMLGGTLYYRELGLLNGSESDVLDINVCNAFLVRISRQSFELAKLISQFSFTAMTISGVYEIRLIHKQLGSYFTIEQACNACGVLLDNFVSDFSGTGSATSGWIAMNQKLEPIGMQMYRI